MAYRQRYQRDVLINLIGYRRLGHNELDEPAYTQPVMSRTIKAHPPVSKIYAQKLVAEGVLTQDEVDAMIAAAERRMREAHEAVTSRGEPRHRAATSGRASGPKPRSVLSAVSADVLREPQRAAPDGARGLHDPPQAGAPARAPPRGDGPRGRHHLGARRGARVRRRCSPRASRCG